jgi:hypothetical protein
VSTEEVLNKAYRLAYFLHQDKGMAIRIVAAAMLKLNVAMAVQSKRLYYIPVGRFSRVESRRTDGIRNKALFSDLHLLQRLIYGESEPFERQKELAAQAGSPGVHADGDPAREDDLLVYFIKHLVRITTKRNAFYVTLGVSRLLHSYSTLETMEIYNAVIGEPERVKDDYYYRSRKAVLMHEMYQRFGQLIRACRQRRGEERFETQEGSSAQRSLMRECLRLFTPWDTQCPVPRDFDPLKTVIARLTSKSSDDEKEIEVNRIHAVLHPDCFGTLVAAFGYSPPEERMELPRFFSQQSDDQSPPRQRTAPAELSAEDLAEINDMLAEEAGRRRRASSAGMIRIIVDGIERGTLNPAEQSSVSFSAPEDAETIEVKTTDRTGELLLATHLLTAAAEEADDATIVTSIRLEGGQELSLSVTKGATGTGELLVTFGYRETNLGRAARLWWQRLRRRLRPEQRRKGSTGLWGEVRIPALATVVVGVLVICVVSYVAYVRLRSPVAGGPAPTSDVAREAAPTSPQGAAPVAQANDRVNEPVPAAIQPAPPIRERSSAPKAPVVSKDVPAQTGDQEIAEDATRSGNVIANLKLGQVKKIYIEIRGDGELNDLRRNVIESFSGGDIRVASAGEADASLKIVVSKDGASARLVNARGVVLWSKSGVRRSSGETTRVTSDLVNDLLTEIRAARGQ